MNRSIFLKVANWISYRMVRLIVGVLVIGIKDKALVNQGD